ncbi:hypothetical protein D3C87_1362900 [compost metagenome]
MVGQSARQETQGVELVHLCHARLVHHNILRAFQHIGLHALDRQLALAHHPGRREKCRAAVARTIARVQVIRAGGRHGKAAGRAAIDDRLGLLDKIDGQQHRQTHAQLAEGLARIAVEVGTGLASAAALRALPGVISQGKGRGDGVAFDRIRRAPYHQHRLDTGLQLAIDALLQLSELVHAQLARPVRNMHMHNIGGRNGMRLAVILPHLDTVRFSIIDDDGQL